MGSISLFSLSRHGFHSFFPLLGVFSWNFGGVFEGRDHEWTGHKPQLIKDGRRTQCNTTNEWCRARCEICKRTNMTKAPCRPYLEQKFGDLTTADHKVLSVGCEPRHNRRHAVVVQDLATQWIQSYPCRLRRNQKRAHASSWNRRGTESHSH